MTAAEFGNSPAASPADRQLVAERYRLLDKIGRGRLGDVFSAVDENYRSLGVEQQVAIQIVPEFVVGNHKLFNRIKAGYESLAAAAHPNIVEYRQFGRAGKIGFLVMELLDGASLRRLLDEVERLPLDEAIPVIRGAGEALQLLHARDLVHGNVTASNIFITDGLKVRLLDVIPIAAAEAIFRGATSYGSSGRIGIEDDVFALACLAYEMLAGKPPFNMSAGAGQTGLAPDRIDGLADSEWDVLRRALSFDRDEQTSTIADFMRGLGIRGTERLRPATVQHVPPPVVDDQSAAPEPVLPVLDDIATAPAAALNLDPAFDINRPRREPARTQGSPARTVLLGTLLAAIGAWYYSGQAEERFVELIGYVDTTLNLGLAARTVQSADVPQSVLAPAAPAEAMASPPAEPEPEATVEVTVSESTPGRPMPDSESVIDEGEGIPAQPAEIAKTPDAAVADEVEIDSPADKMRAETVAEETGPIIKSSTVSVSERNGSARIVVERSGNSTLALIWWTSEHTATANTDFIPVREQAVDLGPGEALYIPLVNDSLPEPLETFFVNFGLRNTLDGRIEIVATVRVDIIDDDGR